MRAKEFLIEKARGLLYRDPGDTFIDPSGQEIRFVKVTYYPSIPGAYQTPEEMDQATKKIETTHKGIKWVNNKNNSTLAASVLEFDIVRNGQPIGKMYFGRYFKQILNDMTSMWKNDGLPGNWQLQKASSLKSSYKLKPGDIFAPNSVFNTPLDLINAMSQSTNGAQWAQESAAILSNQLPIYKGAKDKETAVRDDLGEILSPMAVVQGMINSSGMKQAENDLNNGNTLTGAIKFVASKTEGLKDSEIILPNKTVIGISSKGKSGAKASIKNAYDGLIKVREKAKSPDRAVAANAQKILENNVLAIGILDKIAQNSAIDGPLVLATELINPKTKTTILDQDDVPFIKKLIDEGHTDLTIISAGPEIKQKLSMLIVDVGANTGHPGYNIGYHILTGVARQVADIINTDTKIKFSEACLSFINASPIIQVYTFTKVEGDDVKITKFDALYPPNFRGNIVLDPAKVYYATGNNGKYTFAYSPT